MTRDSAIDSPIDTQRNASNNAPSRNTGTRRACLPLVGAVVVLAMLALDSKPVAAAEMSKFKSAEVTWQEYRRDDLGFRIELPGKPEITVEKDPAFKETVVELPFDVMTFSVTVVEFPKVLSAQQAEQELEGRGVAQKAVGATGSSEFTIDGFPGRENVAETRDYKAVYRNMVVGNRTILVNVGWHPTVDTDAAAQRFLQSFALVRGQR